MHNALHIWMCANKYLYTFKHIYFLSESTHVLRLSRETKSAIFNYLDFFVPYLWIVTKGHLGLQTHCEVSEEKWISRRQDNGYHYLLTILVMVNYFLTGRKISHGKEDHWFCCAGQTRRKGSLRTTWGWFLHMAEVAAVASMPFSLTCSTLDRYKSLFHDTQEEKPWPARRHQTLKKIWKQSTSTGKGAQHH